MQPNLRFICVIRLPPYFWHWLACGAVAGHHPVLSNLHACEEGIRVSRVSELLKCGARASIAAPYC
jgi:hypothetical protein